MQQLHKTSEMIILEKLNAMSHSHASGFFCLEIKQQIIISASYIGTGIVLQPQQ